MKEVEYFNFWMPPKTKRSKPWLTRYKMTMEEAKERFGPDVQPEPMTREVRLHHETPEEIRAAVPIWRTGPPPGGVHYWGGAPREGGKGLVKPDDEAQG